MPALLIHDGYVLDAAIAAVGPFAAFTARYRPALAEEVMEFLYQRDLVNGKASMKPIVTFLSKHLIGWDVKDRTGELAAVTPENLRLLGYPQLIPLLDHVMGYAKGQSEQDEKTEMGLAAAAVGSAGGETFLRRLQKVALQRRRRRSDAGSRTREDAATSQHSYSLRYLSQNSPRRSDP